MAFKKLKDVDIERFLACDPPSGSEFSDLSDDDVEITDEHLFAGNQNLNDDYFSDDLCFDHEEFEQLMNEYDKDAQNYQVFDEASFKKFENKQNVPNIDEPTASTEIASNNNKIVKQNHKRLLRGYKINKKHQKINKVATIKKKDHVLVKKLKTKKQPEKWYPGKDNNYVGNIPKFTGELSSIQAFTPYGYFIQLFPDSIFELIANESCQYAAQNGNFVIV